MVFAPAVPVRSAESAPTASAPERIILTWAGDPAHTQAVTWRTNSPVQSPQAQIAKLDSSPAFEKNAATVAGAAATDDLGPGRTAGRNVVRFEGLLPDSAYCYRVGDGQTWSEWNIFRTASEGPQPFRFLYFGDAQNSIKSLWSRTVRRAYAAAPDARFMAFAGDLVAEGYDDALWGEFNDAMGFISATVPLLPVPGNHDLHRAPGAADSKQVLSVSPLWRHQFALPANGPDAGEVLGQSYFLDYQGVRLIALDVNAWANEDFEPAAKARVAEKQLAWLTKILSANPNRWTIVIQHQPAFAMAKGRDYADMRAALTPLYEKYHVDAVLQGHDHMYARTHKVAGGKVVDPSAPGVIYVISVSGPKMYEAQDMNTTLMAKVVQQKQFYQIVDVTPDRLSLTAYAIDGEIADRFELRKSGAGSLYVDGSSDTPQSK
jgi:3',5'-cyclic AMP phosphodiesterase CpdA